MTLFTRVLHFLRGFPADGHCDVTSEGFGNKEKKLTNNNRKKPLKLKGGKKEIKCSVTIFWGYFSQLANPLCVISEGAEIPVKQVPH